MFGELVVEDGAHAGHHLVVALSRSNNVSGIHHAEEDDDEDEEDESGVVVDRRRTRVSSGVGT